MVWSQWSISNKLPNAEKKKALTWKCQVCRALSLRIYFKHSKNCWNFGGDLSHLRIVTHSTSISHHGDGNWKKKYILLHPKLPELGCLQRLTEFSLFFPGSLITNVQGTRMQNVYYVGSGLLIKRVKQPTSASKWPRTHICVGSNTVYSSVFPLFFHMKWLKWDWSRKVIICCYREVVIVPKQ